VRQREGVVIDLSGVRDGALTRAPMASGAVSSLTGWTLN